MENSLTKDIIKKVRLIELRTRRAVDSILSGGYHSAFKGRGMEFSEVRAYTPGDDVRAIDWNVTARSAQPFVKVFHEERELTVILAVDGSASLDFGTIRATKREMASEISAMLSLSAIKNNDNVGLLLFSGNEEKYIPAKKGRNHALRVLREIISYPAAAKGAGLDAALQRLGKLIKRKCLLFILSDFLDENWTTSLRILAKKHDVVPIVIRDRMEQQLPDIGLVQLYDEEIGAYRLLDTSDASFREQYRQDRQQAARMLDQIFRSSGIEPIFVSSDVAYVQSLMKYFRYRERRR